MATMGVRRAERRQVRWLRAGRAAVFLAAGLPVWAVAAGVVAVPWVLGSAGLYRLPTSVPLVVFALVVPLAAGLWLLPWLTVWQRRRVRRLRGVVVAEALVPRLEFRRVPERGEVVAVLRSEAVWRRVLYHFAVGPLVGLGTVLAAAAAVAGTGGTLWWISLLAQPADEGNRGQFWSGVLFAGLEVCVVRCLPQVVGGLAAVDVAAVRGLLGPSVTVELTRQVETLAVSRAAAVDAADAERRRIERDLHDGAQQVLMSMAMNLGLARRALKDDPDVPPAVLRVIEQSHAQSKQAMTELRDLVRGLHPAVLDDRGLDAALSGVAARSSVPVRLTVAVTRTLSASVETAAYFVVCEALANVVRHSGAASASVEVSTGAGLLSVRVSDDGVGGADAHGGSGLTGLAQRVAAVGGVLHITSPAGGPTVLAAELPYGV